MVRVSPRLRAVCALAQREPLGLLAPQAERANQALARGVAAALAARQVQQRVGLEGLLARQRQAVEVARLRHAPRQLGAGLGGLVDLAQIGQAFLGRHRLDPGAAHLGDALDDADRHLRLLLRELLRGHRARQRHQQQPAQAEVQADLALDLVAAGGAAVAQTGIGQTADLRQLGLRDAEPGQVGLQAAVVQQRQLDRAVLRQRRGQQRVEACARLGRRGLRIGPACDVGASGRAQLLAHRRDRRVGRGRGAAGQRRGRQQGQRQLQRGRGCPDSAAHRAPPGTEAAAAGSGAWACFR